MNHWLIDPIDPLLFGDGRPNTAVPGAVARSRLVPTPSTVAGAVRGRVFPAREAAGEPAAALGQELASAPVWGPLLAQLNPAGEVDEWLFPRPADARELGDAQARELVRLNPQRWPAGCTGSDAALLPVGGAGVGKPWHDPRPLWRWSSELRPWLCTGSSAPVPVTLPQGLGVPGPVAERRTHVALDGETGTVRMGALFGSEGRRWTVRGAQGRPVSLALSVRTELSPPQGPAPIGGERRLASWRPSPVTWPTLPPEVEQAVLHTRHLRVILATPAYFPGGACPIGAPPFGLPGATLCAVCNERGEATSGFDVRAGTPRPTRRLVPAGTVYYLNTTNTDVSTLSAWLHRTWLQPLGGDPACTRDGLGLALIGAWDGPSDFPTAALEHP